MTYSYVMYVGGYNAIVVESERLLFALPVLLHLVREGNHPKGKGRRSKREEVSCLTACFDAASPSLGPSLPPLCWCGFFFTLPKGCVCVRAGEMAGVESKAITITITVTQRSIGVG